MKITDASPRVRYVISFILILATEIIIALFARDEFIRPYGGDILITILLCCFVRIFFLNKPKMLPLWVFIFSVFIEVLQYFDYVALLGLNHIGFFRTWMGTSFSYIDIVCYGTGCLIFYIVENFSRK